jgi:hypothetical protein
VYPEEMQWKNWFRFDAGRVSYMAFEWWVMRHGLAVLAFVTTPAGVPFSSQPMPVGIAKFFDLTWLGAPSTGSWMLPVMILLTILLGFGLAPLLGAAGLLVLQTAASTFTNSQGGGGGSHHSTNLVGLMLLGQVLACLYRDAGALRRGGWRGLLAVRVEDWAWLRHLLRHPTAGFRRASDAMESSAEFFRSLQVYTILQMMAMSYVVSGISKLWRSGGSWLSETRNLPLQFEKNRLNEFHDTLLMPQQTSTDIMAAWIGQHPTMAAMLFGGGLFLELFAFAGLWNRRTLACFGLAIMSMHIMISDLMNLGFLFNKIALLLFWVNVPWWIHALCRRRGLKLHSA